MFTCTKAFNDQDLRDANEQKARHARLSF